MASNAEIRHSSAEGVRWIGPPGSVHAMITLGATVGILIAASSPLGIFVPCCVLAASPVVIVYVTRVIVSRRVAKYDLSGLRIRRPGWWAVLPVCFLICLVAMLTHTPFRIRFERSRAELEREALRLLATSPKEGEPWGEGITRYFGDKKAGVFTIQSADVDHARGHVYLSIDSIVRPSGLVYLGDCTEEPAMGWRVPYLPNNWALFAYP